MPVFGFDDDFPPPPDHGVEHPNGAGGEHERSCREQVVHPRNQPDCKHERCNRPDDRPRTRIDEMVVVLFRMRVGHGLLHSQFAGAARV
jgi:hypothetical protein